MERLVMRLEAGRTGWMVGATSTSRVDTLRLAGLELCDKYERNIISMWTKSSNLEKFVLEDICTVADNLLLWRQHRNRNGWQEGSFEDLC